MTKGTALRRLLIVFAALFAFCASGAAHAQDIQIETPQGALIGRDSPRDAAIAVFKGVPFAKPPVGARRWTYAEPFGAWKGRAHCLRVRRRLRAALDHDGGRPARAVLLLSSAWRDE